MIQPSLDTLLIVAGIVLALVVLLAVLVLRDPAAATRRIEAAFRRAPKPPRTAGKEQYYQPYWSR